MRVSTLTQVAPNRESTWRSWLRQRAECVTLSGRTPKEGTCDRGHVGEPSEEKVPQLDL